MKKKKLLNRLETQLFVAVNMHYWNVAFNICKRIDRVKTLRSA